MPEVLPGRDGGGEEAGSEAPRMLMSLGFYVSLLCDPSLLGLLQPQACPLCPAQLATRRGLPNLR